MSHVCVPVHMYEERERAIGKMLSFLLGCLSLTTITGFVASDFLR